MDIKIWGNQVQILFINKSKQLAFIIILKFTTSHKTNSTFESPHLVSIINLQFNPLKKSTGAQWCMSQFVNSGNWACWERTMRRHFSVGFILHMFGFTKMEGKLSKGLKSNENSVYSEFWMATYVVLWLCLNSITVEGWNGKFSLNFGSSLKAN